MVWFGILLSLSFRMAERDLSWQIEGSVMTDSRQIPLFPPRTHSFTRLQWCDSHHLETAHHCNLVKECVLGGKRGICLLSVMTDPSICHDRSLSAILNDKLNNMPNHTIRKWIHYKKEHNPREINITYRINILLRKSYLLNKPTSTDTTFF
jgi:hypothetical protein